MWPVHGLSNRGGNRQGHLGADRIDLLAIGRRQRGGLAPQPDEFGTADFLESMVECSGYGTHAWVDGKHDAAEDWRGFWPENAQKTEISQPGVPNIRQAPSP